MGIDTDQLVGEFDWEGLGCGCAICSEILCDTVTLSKCEHNFCGLCLDALISTGDFRCPECRSSFSKDDVSAPPRFMRNVLSKIRLQCEFTSCGMVLGYDQYGDHSLRCQYNPDAKVACSYCETQYMKVDKTEHQQDCKNYLKFENIDLKSQIEDAEYKAEQQTIQVEKLKCDKNSLCKEVNALKSKLKTAENELAKLRSQRDKDMKTIKTGQTELKKEKQLKIAKTELAGSKQQTDLPDIVKERIAFLMN
mgnify:CR=1 FL=1